MQPAELTVEVDQPGGGSRQLAVALEGFGRHLHRSMQGVGEGDEALGRPAGLGQGEQLLFGLFDLVAGGHLGVGGGLCGDLAADANQVSAQGEVVDGAGVVGGVGGRRRAVHEVGEIADAAELLERSVPAEAVRQQDRVGGLAAADMLLHHLEQALVERLEEMARQQPIRQPLVGGVVIEQGAQQRLLRLDIAGHGLAERRRGGFGRGEVEGGGRHGLPIA